MRGADGRRVVLFGLWVAAGLLAAAPAHAQEELRVDVDLRVSVSELRVDMAKAAFDVLQPDHGARVNRGASSNPECVASALRKAGYVLESAKTREAMLDALAKTIKLAKKILPIGAAGDVAELALGYVQSDAELNAFGRAAMGKLGQLIGKELGRRAAQRAKGDATDDVDEAAGKAAGKIGGKRAGERLAEHLFAGATHDDQQTYPDAVCGDLNLVLRFSPPQGASPGGFSFAVTGDCKCKWPTQAAALGKFEVRAFAPLVLGPVRVVAKRLVISASLGALTYDVSASCACSSPEEAVSHAPPDPPATTPGYTPGSTCCGELFEEWKKWERARERREEAVASAVKEVDRARSELAAAAGRVGTSGAARGYLRRLREASARAEELAALQARNLEGDRRREAEARAAYERCRERCEDTKKSVAIGFEYKVGASVGMGSREHQFATVLAPSVAFFAQGRGSLQLPVQILMRPERTTIAVPVVAQFEQPLGIANLSIVFRGGAGYATERFANAGEHALVLLAEAGLAWSPRRAVKIGLEPASLATFVGAQTTTSLRFFLWGSVGF